MKLTTVFSTRSANFLKAIVMDGSRDFLIENFPLLFFLTTLGYRLQRLHLESSFKSIISLKTCIFGEINLCLSWVKH